MNAIESQPWYLQTLELVKRKHAGRQDQFGRDYYEHFVRVGRHLLERFPQATPDQVQAALLHDAFEPDGALDETTLRSHGVTPRAIEIIRRITLPTDGRSYLDYIRDLCASGDTESIQVKLADNIDAFAVFGALGTAEAKEMIERQYVPARGMLEVAADAK